MRHQPRCGFVLLGVVLVGCATSDLDRFKERVGQLNVRDEQTEQLDQDFRQPARDVVRLQVRPSPTDESLAGLQIHIFDAGQADAMLLVSADGKTMLVDLGEGGGTENFLTVAQRILDVTGRARVDYLVVSHYHQDHTGRSSSGIAGLLDYVDPQFVVGTLIDLQEIGAEYMSARRSTKDGLDDKVTAWLSDGTVERREEPEFGTHQVNLGGDVEIEIVVFGGRTGPSDDGAFAEVVEHYPTRYEEAPGSENDISIGMVIRYGDFEFFTAGDLTGYAPADWPDFEPLFTPRVFGSDPQTYTNVESRLAENWRDAPPGLYDVEVYRANHHGSRYSSSPALLQALDPEVVVYSCGGRHGHPELPVVEAVADTARQYATTKVASGSWNRFDELGGQLVGEIFIQVAPSGQSYDVNGVTFEAFADADEAAGADDDAHHP